MIKKVPNPIDRHVGSRVRMRRMLAGVSQEKLGEALGLTFQQVQKYEKGANRISASRLQQIAKMLDVPVSFFFEGAPTGDMPESGFADAAATTYISEFLATSEGVQLTKAFTRIRSGRVRRRIIDLVEALAEEDAGSA
ncbi:helix-turn-helix transcriptional regulator [Bosea sp. (in: a-proteobacteria)]|uniref:helix-turn-helix domain-containing protein n=1 Tax=Bosea sp. (in: a-proteobacteria) TaxID=1871050 RepID=UPI002608A5C9|nr:helix-turn-helix transcriptional regulator [Bosea sp. (in: a-proteobacteria)]MCO5090474.1 helix-turn-helix transcriptional regulator [Bosea sp. (in: a-proteobacteria)]